MEHLYRFYDQSGALLYVGISNDFAGRLRAHERSSGFFKDVQSITLERYSTRDEVIAAEKLAIQTELPLHNKAWNIYHENVNTHFQRIKNWYLYDDADDTHANLISLMREEISVEFKPKHLKPKHIAAALIDQCYGDVVECELCHMIADSPFYESIANYAWKEEMQ
jgi:predicted GIY-YIG superfamily endonuclease